MVALWWAKRAEEPAGEAGRASISGVIFRKRAAPSGTPPISPGTGVFLGLAIALSTGIVLVRAADSPTIRETFLELGKPIGRATQNILPFSGEWSRLFERSGLQAKAVIREAPAQPPSSHPVNPIREPVALGLPWPRAEGGQPLAHESHRAALAAKYGPAIREPGLATATNYCVRLCDGFAFPTGRAGIGHEAAHHATCRQLCPNAATALYTMPRGTKDFSEGYSPSNGTSYADLPMAFRYRERYDIACTCRPKGSTQPASALLTDLSLKPGDLAMTRSGIRHFDGGSLYPLQPAQFSDWSRALRNPREIQLVRGMEAASLRGIIPVEGQAGLRERVSGEIRRIEAQADLRPLDPARIRASRFEEIRPAPMAGPQPIRKTDRGPGIIALN